MPKFRTALLALVFLLGFAPQAPATILWAGGEDDTLQLIGATTTSTNSTFFRSGYARLAMGVSFGSITDPPINRFVTPTFANQSTIWIHAETYQQTSASTNSSMNGISIYGSDGIVRLVVSGSASATFGQVTIRKRTSGGVYTNLVSSTAGTFPATALHKLDLFVNYAVSGEVTLYVDGTQVADFVGDVTTGGITAVNQVDFAGLNIDSAADYWSELIISTTDTRNMNLVTLSPTSNGTTMAWSGSVSNVNGTNYNDLAALTTGTNSLIAEFNTGTMPAGSFTIPAVVQSARMEIGTSGPQHFSYIIRPGSGSTDYSSSNVAPTTAFANYQNIWTTNPATSAGWTFADMNNIQFGVESQP